MTDTTPLIERLRADAGLRAAFERDPRATLARELGSEPTQEQIAATIAVLGQATHGVIAPQQPVDPLAQVGGVIPPHRQLDPLSEVGGVIPPHKLDEELAARLKKF